MIKALMAVSLFLALTFNAYAVEKSAVPSGDLKGARDSSLIGRYQGSLIVSELRKAFDESTLEQIAKLLSDDPELKLLVVGHTDNAWTLSFNMDLSQRRANAVVSALVTQHHVNIHRLTPVGVSFACPVATNKTEDGRAKNRRVELVEN